MATDELSGPANDGEDRGPMRAMLSNAIVAVMKELYGKGAEQAKTYINDEYVFVVLQGALTRNEETLLAAGEVDLVRTYRLRFQEAIAETITSEVERITRRKVRTYHSQLLIDPARIIEMFVLDEAPDHG